MPAHSNDPENKLAPQMMITTQILVMVTEIPVMMTQILMMMITT